MRRFVIAVPVVLAACQTDYDLQKEEEPENGTTEVTEGLSDDPVGDSAEPEDTGEVDPGDGSTGDEPEKPVAVCDVTPNPVEPPFETATWIGSGSYDPEGLAIVDYAWALNSAPSGSSARMATGTSADRGGFEADLAGEYVASLTVTTEDGRISDPCQVTLESIPAENLWVEMFWTYSGDDMDLHLLAPGGYLEDYNTDCYFVNCTGGLSWGSSGTADDPYLDLDDISGTGPENINIAAPSPGTYTVYVHDYPGSVYNSGNPVTVRVYINGVKLYDQTKTITTEDSYTAFASINWNSGTVTPL